MAGMEGVEPSLTEPESAVLPLDDIPVLVLIEHSVPVNASRDDTQEKISLQVNLKKGL